MGSATEADSFMSAVIDRKAFDRISGYINHAKTSPNCSIVAGGGYDDSVGYFIEPTIVQTTTPPWTGYSRRRPSANWSQFMSTLTK